MKTTWGKKIAFLIVGLCTLVIAGGALLSSPHLVLAAATSTASTTDPVTQPEINCDWDEVQCMIGKFFYNAVYVTFGTLVYIAASFFDFVIKLSILDFHTWAGLPGVKIAWTVLRDTMNITFIFLLLYASISMILGLGKEKGIVKGVILAGLLINFSFFFTSVMIDASNVVTVQMHEAIKTIGDNISQGTGSATSYEVTGITAVFMRGTGIQVATIQGLDSGEFVSRLFQQMLFSSIEFLILAFVFFAMGFFLLGRFIVLLILLITSPISVMGGLLPQLKEHSKKWWTTLIGQVTFAPIMMLFLVVTAVVISNQQFRDGFSKASDTGLVGGVGGLAQYAIVIGLLVMSIVIAKKTAGAASNGATDWAVKKAQSVATAPGRWAGAAAGAVGGAAGAVAGGVSGAVGRFGVKKIVNPLSTKYDLAMGKLEQSDSKWKRGVATAARGLGVDEGVRDTFKGVAALKFGSQTSLAQREKEIAERRKETGQAVKDDEVQKKIEAGMKLSNELRDDKKYDTDHVATDAAGNVIKDANGDPVKPIADFIKEVGKLTNNQIEEMLQKGDKRLTDQTFASALTAKHMEKILESALISDKAKGDIVKAREGGMLARLDSTKVRDVAAEAKRFASGKPSDVAQLPSKVLVDPQVASRLTIGALSKIASEGKVNEDDKAAIRAGIQKTLQDLNNLPISSTPAEYQAAADRIDEIQKTLDWLKSDAGKIF